MAASEEGDTVCQNRGVEGDRYRNRVSLESVWL